MMIGVMARAFFLQFPNSPAALMTTTQMIHLRARTRKKKRAQSREGWAWKKGKRRGKKHYGAQSHFASPSTTTKEPRNSCSQRLDVALLGFTVNSLREEKTDETEAKNSSPMTSEEAAHEHSRRGEKAMKWEVVTPALKQ